MNFRELASQLIKINLPDADIFSIGDLIQFESQTGIMLPDDYKDFCQFFGSGQFGKYVRVYCPRTSLTEKAISLLENCLNSAREELEVHPSKRMSTEQYEEIQQLLGSCFVIGSTPNCHDIVWDLRTFNENDKSYDIYLVPTDSLDEFFFVERKFSDFVENFCLSIQGYKDRKLPKYVWPLKGDIQATFRQYPKSSADFGY